MHQGDHLVQEGEHLQGLLDVPEVLAYAGPPYEEAFDVLLAACQDVVGVLPEGHWSSTR